MASTIVSKIVVGIIGILVLTQILFYNALQTRNANEAGHEKERLILEAQRLSEEKIELQQNLADLRNEYEQIVAAVPQEILTGYEDHEILLAGFLDSLKAPAYKKVNAKFTMQGGQKFIEQPVPAFESSINFSFSFRQLKDAESFLNLVLGQSFYPLMIRNLEMRSDGQPKITGNLQTSLLIPAKQKSPFFKNREGS